MDSYKLINILRKPHISEKSTSVLGKTNTFIFKVDKRSTKKQIKIAFKLLFNIEILSINTLITKGKIKKKGATEGRRSDVKKAYITLKSGDKIQSLLENK